MGKVSTKKVVIKIRCGFVTGFSRTYQIVQVCDSIDNAKKFTPISARSFIDKYADCGYGMGSDTVDVIEV